MRTSHPGAWSHLDTYDSEAIFATELCSDIDNEYVDLDESWAEQQVCGELPSLTTQYLPQWALVVSEDPPLQEQVRDTLRHAFSMLQVHHEVDVAGSSSEAVDFVQVMQQAVALGCKLPQHYAVIVVAGSMQYIDAAVSVLRHACHYSSLVILTPPGPLTPGLLHCQQSDPNFHTMVQPMCLEHILEIIEDPLGLANSQFPATTPLWQDLLSFEEPSQPQWLEQCVSSSKIVPPPPEPSPEPIPLQQQDFRITATVPPQPRRPSKGHDKKDECKIFSPEFRQHSEECNRRPQGRLWSIWSTVFQPSRVVFSVAATGDRSPTFCRVNTTFEDVFGFTQEDLQSCTLQDKLVGPATDQQGLMDLWRFVDEDELPGDPRPLQLYSKSKQCLDSYVALNLLTDPRSDHGIQLVLMTVVGITALGYLDEPEHLAEFDRQKHPAPKRKRKRQQPSTAVERATCPWVAEASPRPRAQPAQYPSA